MNKRISALISEIIDLASTVLHYDDDKNYVCVGIYDCRGSWQVWLDYGVSGYTAKQRVLFGEQDYIETATLLSALREMKRRLTDKTLSLRNK